MKNIKINQSSKIKNLLNDRLPLKIFIYLAVTINILIIVLVLILQNNLPPQVPLFYGLTESEDQLSTSLGLLIPNSIALLTTTFNIFITLIIANPYLKKMLSVTSFTISLMSAITVVRIILLVGFFK